MAKPISPAPPLIAAPGRWTDLPTEDVHLRLAEAIEKLKVPRIRNSCRSALNHLRCPAPWPGVATVFEDPE